MSQPSFSAEDYSATPVSYPPLEVIDLVALSQGDSVEYENVNIAKAMRSLLNSSAWSLLFANVSHASW